MRERINRYIWDYNARDTAAPRSPWRHFLQIVAVVGRDLVGGMITLRAMGLVYTTLLSIVPLLAVSISVLKGFGVHDQLEPTLVQILAPLGEKSVEISARIVGFVENMKIGVLGIVGLAMLIYTAVSLIQKIESAFNYCWRLEGGRGVMQRFSDYLSVIMVGPVLIFTAVGITASLGSNQFIGFLNALPYMNDLLHLVGKLLPFVLVIVAFTFVYLLVPHTRVQVKSALYGAVIAGVMWETSGILFTSFIGGSTSYTAVYSGLAILLVFMIWLYVSWVILLVGASISFYHQHPEHLRWRELDIYLSARMREQLALQVMVNIALAYDRRDDLPTDLKNLAGYQQVPREMLIRMLDALQAGGLLQQTAGKAPHYLPGASLRSIRLVDILRCARNADDDGNSDHFHCDGLVSKLLAQAEMDFEARLGEQTLAEFIQNHESRATHEDSLV